MPAIITNAFRTYNADQFISSFSTNKMYLMIGKADAWSGASAGQYAEASPSDTSIPTPIDTVQAPFIHHNDMIAAKLINACRMAAADPASTPHVGCKAIITLGF